jgi:hypothetical protein
MANLALQMVDIWDGRVVRRPERDASRCLSPSRRVHEFRRVVDGGSRWLIRETSYNYSIRSGRCSLSFPTPFRVVPRQCRTSWNPYLTGRQRVQCGPQAVCGRREVVLIWLRGVSENVSRRAARSRHVSRRALGSALRRVIAKSSVVDEGFATSAQSHVALRRP